MVNHTNQEPTYPTGNERRPASRINLLRYWLPIALVLMLATLGTPHWGSMRADAAAPTVYEVVSAHSDGTWFYVQGPESLTQAKVIQSRLQRTKIMACRLHLNACGNTYTIYQLTRV